MSYHSGILRSKLVDKLYCFCNTCGDTINICGGETTEFCYSESLVVIGKMLKKVWNFGCLSKNENSKAACFFGSSENLKNYSFSCCNDMNFCNNNFAPLSTDENIDSSYVICLSMMFLSIFIFLIFSIERKHFKKTFRKITKKKLEKGRFFNKNKKVKECYSFRYYKWGYGRFYDYTEMDEPKKMLLKRFKYEKYDLWKNEYRMFKQFGLLHPNVIGHVSSFSDDTSTYSIFSTTNTITLDKFIDQGDLTVSEAFRIVEDCCLGLEYINSLKIVHLNLNPKCIRKKEDGGYCICDLEFAVTTDDFNYSIQSTEDKRYVAPEVLSKGYHSRNNLLTADSFSINVVTWVVVLSAVTSKRQSPPKKISGSNFPIAHYNALLAETRHVLCNSRMMDDLYNFVVSNLNFDPIRRRPVSALRSLVCELINQ